MPVWTTLDHVTIVTDDFEASRPVYDALLGAIGLTPAVDYSDPEGDADDTGRVAALGYLTQTQDLLLVLAAGQTATTGAHVALAVSDRLLVDSAVSAARSAGARIVQAPREWEAAQLKYYGVQVTDPAGNIIEIVHRS
jgi:catechol 2,3-dioxygenase-like lactoylglutathione lyase family enzyme